MPKHAPRAETRHIAGLLQLSTAADITHGKDWYAKAGRFAAALADRYGITIEHAAGVLAALSPNNKWSRNKTDAETLIAAHVNGDDPANSRVSTYGQNKAKALAILAADVDDIPGLVYGTAGRKVLAFYESILGSPTAVCVDGHAYAVWVGRRVPIGDTPTIGKGLYETIARAYTLVARRSKALCGLDLTPTEVQAVTWTVYRRVYGIK